jgi:hypothetical protein
LEIENGPLSQLLFEELSELEIENGPLSQLLFEELSELEIKTGLCLSSFLKIASILFRNIEILNP